MALQTDGPAPYGPPQTIIEVIEGFRDRGFAVPFTSDVLVRAGVSESVVPRTLQSLRLLDLINDEGNPTETLEAFRRTRGQDEYKAALQDWLRNVYADVLQFTDPAVDALQRITEAFRGYTPQGQR